MTYWRLFRDAIESGPTGLHLAAGAAEETAVDVIANASRFDIIVQTLIETMVSRNVVLLAAFFM